MAGRHPLSNLGRTVQNLKIVGMEDFNSDLGVVIPYFFEGLAGDA